MHEFSRTELLIGKEAVEKLKKSRVAVFGIGGVGSFAVEGLVRAGVGSLVLVDADCVCVTNLNRQLPATRKTIGKPKVEVMRERVLEINPEAEVVACRMFYTPDCSDELVKPNYDYIVDAMDTVTAKIDLVVKAQRKGIPVISCMGAGNKLDPTKFRVDDIYNTTICPLAKVMRRELKKTGVTSLKVVYSTEEPIKPVMSEELSLGAGCPCTEESIAQNARRQITGSISFVPSVAGLIMAGEVIKDLISWSRINEGLSINSI